MELLSVAQRKMERIMLGITLYVTTNVIPAWIRHQTGVNDNCYHRRYQEGNTWMGGTRCTIQIQHRCTKRVTECHENGQDSREDLKQDGETTLYINRHLGSANSQRPASVETVLVGSLLTE